jgi:hypothetical protein
MNPASILIRFPTGLNVMKASWMFRPGAFFPVPPVWLAGVHLEQVRIVDSEEVLEVLESRSADHEPDTAQEQVLRHQGGVGCAHHLELRLSEQAELDALAAQRVGGRRAADVRRHRRRGRSRLCGFGRRRGPGGPLGFAGGIRRRRLRGGGWLREQ